MKRMNSLSVGAVIALLSGVAFGAPVYLDCSYRAGDETKEFSVKIDEATGKITHTVPTGQAFNAEGFFSSDEVTYQHIILTGSSRLTQQFKIDRTNLSLTFIIALESVNFPDQSPAKSFSYEGKCKRANTKGRKF